MREQFQPTLNVIFDSVIKEIRYLFFYMWEVIRNMFLLGVENFVRSYRFNTMVVGTLELLWKHSLLPFKIVDGGLITTKGNVLLSKRKDFYFSGYKIYNILDWLNGYYLPSMYYTLSLVCKQSYMQVSFLRTYLSDRDAIRMKIFLIGRTLDRWDPRGCDHFVERHGECDACVIMKQGCLQFSERYDICSSFFRLNDRDMIQLFLYLDDNLGAFEALQKYFSLLIAYPPDFITTGLLALILKKEDFIWKYGLIKVSDIVPETLIYYLYKGNIKFNNRNFDYNSSTSVPVNLLVGSEYDPGELLRQLLDALGGFVYDS